MGCGCSDETKSIHINDKTQYLNSNRNDNAINNEKMVTNSSPPQKQYEVTDNYNKEIFKEIPIHFKRKLSFKKKKFFECNTDSIANQNKDNVINKNKEKNGKVRNVDVEKYMNMIEKIDVQNKNNKLKDEARKHKEKSGKVMNVDIEKYMNMIEKIDKQNKNKHT